MATYYIDPDATVNGSGTQANPYNAWPSLNSSNTYLQKCGTTASSTNLTAFGKSSITVGSYGTGVNPTVNGGTGIALSASNSTGISISNIDFVSTGHYGVSWNGGATFSVTDSEIVGQRAGLNIISNASAVSSVTLTRVTASHTTAVNEQAGLFIGAQNGNAITGVTITDCTFSNGATYGAVIKAGDSNSSSLISGVVIDDCDFSDNVSIGLFITTGMTALSEEKIVTETIVRHCRALRNGGPGMALCIRGGNSVVAYNTVNENNSSGATGTGGLQLTGAQGVACYGNVCNYNHTATGFDGVGLYLDVCTTTLNNVGTEACLVFGNWCEGNDDYSPDAADIAGNPPSAGIAIYHSHNNIVTGNVCVANAAGVVVSLWSTGNTIANNTLVRNKYGIAINWQKASHANIARNNLIIGSTSHGLHTTDIGTRTTTGDITLSDTSGLVTCTSTANDFATYSTGYAVAAGTGYGFVVSKTSSAIVTIKVLVTFSSTTFAHGNWSLTFGEDQGAWSNYNCFFGNATNVYAGTGQSIAIGAQSLTSDPLLTAEYVLGSGSPSINAGVTVDGVALRDFYGKEIVTTVDIGAKQKYTARAAASRTAIGVARTAITSARSGDVTRAPI